MFTKPTESFTLTHSEYREQLWVKRQAFLEKPFWFPFPGISIPWIYTFCLSYSWVFKASKAWLKQSQDICVHGCPTKAHRFHISGKLCLPRSHRKRSSGCDAWSEVIFCQAKSVLCPICDWQTRLAIEAQLEKRTVGSWGYSSWWEEGKAETIVANAVAATCGHFWQQQDCSGCSGSLGHHQEEPTQSPWFSDHSGQWRSGGILPF